MTLYYRIAILLLSFLLVSSSYGQSVNDALRYATLYPGGSARVIGAGSSFGAMGGDFGSLSINPAGLADFRSSEIVFSFSFNAGTTSSMLRGIPQATDHQVEPNIENLGLVIHTSPMGGIFQTSNFAIGLQQYNSYNENFSYSGQTEGSIAQRFLEISNGFTRDELDAFEGALAFETAAILEESEREYISDFIPSDLVNKSQEVSRSGKYNEFVLAWAGKMHNNLSIGLGVGIPFVSFEEDKAYFENDVQDLVPFFDRLSFTERLSTSGAGINAKIGLGYTINRIIRLGLSYQTPSYLKLDDNFDTALSYTFTDVDGTVSSNAVSPDGRFDYRLRTPSRMVASIGTLINTDGIKGFLNVDAQYINYGGSRFNLTAFSDDPGELAFQEQLNGLISDQLESTLNLNVGGELAYKKLRLRSGIGIYTTGEVADQSGSDKIYSAGLGFRENKFYIDLSYQKRDFREQYVPYRLSDTSLQQTVDNQADVSKITFTIGYKI